MTDRLGALRSFRPPTTPALCVERATLEHNLTAMQGFCDAAGVALRAHGKMHKCSRLGLRQIEVGAVGLCCQTVGEAVAFVAAGVHDVLVTSPVPPWGPAMLAGLAKSGATVAAVADSAAQVARLSEAAVAARVTLGVLVDIDLGTHRTGAQPEDAPALVRIAASAPGLEWRGLQGYLGHIQHTPDLAARRAAAEAGQRALRDLAARLTAEGLAPRTITGAGTGTFTLDLASTVFTEIQAGSYALMDVEYEDCGAPDGGPWPFRPALFLGATVVSDRQGTHATCDAGLKAFSVDGPPARVEGGAPDGSRWRSMGDEHGAIVFPKDVNDRPREGDIVWLQPGHCDPTINLHPTLYVVAEDGSFEAWPVDARR